MKMKKIFSLLLILGLLIMPVRKCSATKTVAELEDDLKSVKVQIESMRNEVASTNDTEQLAGLEAAFESLALQRDNIERELDAAHHNGTGVRDGLMIGGMLAIAGAIGYGVGLISGNSRNRQEHCSVA
jgi:hypothetical protein